MSSAQYKEFLAFARRHSGPHVDVSENDFGKMFQDAVEYFTEKSDDIDRIRSLSLEALKHNYHGAESRIDDFSALTGEGDVVTWEALCTLVSTRVPWLVWITFLRLHHLSGGP